MEYQTAGCSTACICCSAHPTLRAVLHQVFEICGNSNLFRCVIRHVLLDLSQIQQVKSAPAAHSFQRKLEPELARSKLLLNRTVDRIQFQRGGRTFRIVLNVLLLLMADCEIMAAQGSDPLVLGDKPLSYSLPEGDTTFIIRVPKPSLLEQFTFVNEKTAVRGALKIAVSNASLPASDPKWNPVNGEIVFAHKRLFNLSMVGVEARYLKLSFHVEKEGQFASVRL